MLESEQLLKEGDPKLERLYIATGYGLIQSVKAFMSFEEKDLLAALELMKTGSNIAIKHRKPVSLASKVSGLVFGGSPVTWFKSMTPVQRHAELVYAECLAQKAILGIVYSGDWLQFIKEAINMRSCIALYRGMYAYLEAVDAESMERGDGPCNIQAADLDFRSGVYLGMGVTHLVLSLLPSRVVPILELFGYKGDRKTALMLLEKAGGWKKGQDQPSVSREQEGCRRSLCDIVLLLFHLVFSGFTYDGVDIDFAESILAWNAQRYPSGVFFLFGQGRLALFRADPALAIKHYTAGMEVVQEQFRSLQGISLWELAVSHLAMWNVSKSAECWRKLKADAGWSKAVYTYGLAVCLASIDGEKEQEEAVMLMESVPGLLKKIAGKSIPLEKWVSRKARKFIAQGNRLLLPAIELSYVLLIHARAPTDVLVNTLLPQIEESIRLLKDCELRPGSYPNPSSSKSKESSLDVATKKSETENGYWDDYCLAHFLRGVCYRYVAYPDPYAAVKDKDTLGIGANEARESFDFVLAHGKNIVYDHNIVYWTHYELARLESRMGNKEEARRHIELILGGRVPEVDWHGRKVGKYSLENALNVRANAALEALENDRLL
ncbi:hypothetical protein CPB86DRAFT_809145 [Serendipita vermifera]|nr:hypothetical protein CPB86DRAFT_809145 [Serendipita vermifera]